MKLSPPIRPQPLVRIPEPFNDPAWLFELKLDGFRALACIENRECRLVSRNGHVYRTFDHLRAGVLRELKVKDAIVDGEIVCLDQEGRSIFDPLLFRRCQPVFAAGSLPLSSRFMTAKTNRKYQNGMAKSPMSSHPEPRPCCSFASCFNSRRAGSKTTAAEKAAEALGLKFYGQSLGPQTTASNIFGFVAANGSYVPGFVHKPMVEGGVVLLDESTGPMRRSSRCSIPSSRTVLPYSPMVSS